MKKLFLLGAWTLLMIVFISCDNGTSSGSGGVTVKQTASLISTASVAPVNVPSPSPVPGIVPTSTNTSEDALKKQCESYSMPGWTWIWENGKCNAIPPSEDYLKAQCAKAAYMPGYIWKWENGQCIGVKQ